MAVWVEELLVAVPGTEYAITIEFSNPDSHADRLVAEFC